MPFNPGPSQVPFLHGSLGKRTRTSPSPLRHDAQAPRPGPTVGAATELVSLPAPLPPPPAIRCPLGTPGRAQCSSKTGRNGAVPSRPPPAPLTDGGEGGNGTGPAEAEARAPPPPPPQLPPQLGGRRAPAVVKAPQRPSHPLHPGHPPPPPPPSFPPSPSFSRRAVQ